MCEKKTPLPHKSFLFFFLLTKKKPKPPPEKKKKKSMEYTMAYDDEKKGVKKKRTSAATWTLMRLPDSLLGCICRVLDVCDFYRGVVPLCRSTVDRTKRHLSSFFPLSARFLSLHGHGTLDEIFFAKSFSRLLHTTELSIHLFNPINRSPIPTAVTVLATFPNLRRLSIKGDYYTWQWSTLLSLASTLVHVSLGRITSSSSSSSSTTSTPSMTHISTLSPSSFDALRSVHVESVNFADLMYLPLFLTDLCVDNVDTWDPQHAAFHTLCSLHHIERLSFSHVVEYREDPPDRVDMQLDTLFQNMPRLHTVQLSAYLLPDPTHRPLPLQLSTLSVTKESGRLGSVWLRERVEYMVGRCSSTLHTLHLSSLDGVFFLPPLSMSHFRSLSLFYDSAHPLSVPTMPPLLSSFTYSPAAGGHIPLPPRWLRDCKTLTSLHLSSTYDKYTSILFSNFDGSTLLSLSLRLYKREEQNDLSLFTQVALSCPQLRSLYLMGYNHNGWEGVEALRSIDSLTCLGLGPPMYLLSSSFSSSSSSPYVPTIKGLQQLPYLKRLYLSKDWPLGYLRPLLNREGDCEILRCNTICGKCDSYWCHCL